MPAVTESDLELATLEWFADLGYEVLPAENFEPESVYDERSSLSDPILQGRLAAAVRRLNPELSEDSVAEVLRVVMRREKPTLALENEELHRLIVDGVELDTHGADGTTRGVRASLIDFANPDANDWVVTNQLTVVDRQGGTGRPRRLDVVVFINGLPLAVFELKNPSDPQADVGKAIQQLRNYREDVPSVLVPNVVLVASDDVEARIGSLTADASRYGLWRTIEGEHDAPKNAQPLEVLVRGVFEKSRFLDYVQNFVTFEHGGSATGTEVHKKIAAYHQFHAVRRAVEETVRAAKTGGDRRAGVVWHTQGSGKSLTMTFYARKLVLDPRMENPTLVVLTDRNDLDEQLFGTFAKSERLLRQRPVQAQSRQHLRDLLKTASGGVYFTTVQKFAPDDPEDVKPLSLRRNIVVIADEAHRSQYGFEAKLNRKTGKMSYGLAKHLRDALKNATFIGFTGTPIELEDKSTVEVFGNHISVYDILQAVEDRATVPIYYENRLARLDLSEEQRPKIDPDFEELTEGEEADRKEALKSEWSTIEALVGTDDRLRLIAKDLVEHYERRTETLAGKALVVCMSRRIAAALHDKIVELRPQWLDKSDDAGSIKVVITGSSSDESIIRPHVRTKAARERLADRFKDPDDPLKIVIVRDMWLTGFDAPCLHTLYVDKPMRGHNLMQAIARVNRVFGDKPGGLVVDYIGIASFLKQALETYRKSGERGQPTRDKQAIVAVLLEQLEICRDVFHGFDVQRFLTGKPSERLAMLPAAREHVLAQKEAESPAKGASAPLDGHDRFQKAVSMMTAAFAAAVPHETCEAVREEVAFYQAVRAGLLKLEGGRKAPGADLHLAVRQIVSNALVTTEVVDVFAAAGLERPDISILSPEFLVEVQGMKHKNLAAALLERLLRDQVRAREQRNVVQGKRFSEMLEDALRRYRARSITNVEVIEELLAIAHSMRDADERGAAMKLSSEESAFYDALAENKSAVEAMQVDELAKIARLLGDVVRTTATIDWNHKKSVQAKLRIAVKKVLSKHGYPPDQCERAAKLVIEQAERMKINLVEGGADAMPVPDEEETPVERGELPYPVAVFDGLFASQPNAALLDGTEGRGGAARGARIRDDPCSACQRLLSGRATCHFGPRQPRPRSVIPELRAQLRQIEPTVLQELLRSRGWKLTEDRSATGVAAYERDGLVIDVPLDTKFTDYTRRLEELVELLAHTEKMSATGLIDMLTEPVGDVISLRMDAEVAASGTLPFEASLKLRLAARTMLLASAHSTMTAQPWFPRLSRSEAVDLVRNAREGQTQRGSFVARFIIPVDPALAAMQLFEVEEPFGRRVVRTLLRALDVVRHVRSLGDVDGLLGKEREGISGNLLLALEQMAPPLSGALEVSVAWARNRPPPVDGPPNVVRLPSEALRGLSAVAGVMQAQAPAPGMEIFGYVTKLSRDPAGVEGPGEITVVPTDTGSSGWPDDARALSRVSAELGPAEYDAAILAHKAGERVRLVGTLQKKGRRWILSQVTACERVEGDPDPG